MELLSCNATAQVRRAFFQGREYLVAPMSIIVPGVLNGSKGALYYPADEVAKDYGKWNGTPMVLYHPTDNEGTPLRATGNPDVLNKSMLGVLRNSAISKEGKLLSEGWFDIQLTKKVAPYILDSLYRKQPIELSTGLFTDNVKAKPGDNFNGRPYTHVARNYRPDHLAILPDQVGACSLTDGCGVLVNEAVTDNKWSAAAIAASIKARALRAKRKVTTTVGRAAQIVKAMPGDLKQRAKTALGIKDEPNRLTAKPSHTQHLKPKSADVKLGAKPKAKIKSRAESLLATTYSSEKRPKPTAGKQTKAIAVAKEKAAKRDKAKQAVGKVVSAKQGLVDKRSGKLTPAGVDSILEAAKRSGKDPAKVLERLQKDGHTKGSTSAAASSKLKEKASERKATIQQAAKTLKSFGLELGKGHTDLKTGKTSYEVKHTKTGKTARVSASSIKEVLKKAAQPKKTIDTGRVKTHSEVKKQTETTPGGKGYVKSKDRWYKSLKSKKPTRNEFSPEAREAAEEARRQKAQGVADKINEIKQRKATESAAKSGRTNEHISQIKQRNAETSQRKNAATKQRIPDIKARRAEARKAKESKVTRNEAWWMKLGQKLGLVKNCGGKGGTPGPCKGQTAASVTGGKLLRSKSIKTGGTSIQTTRLPGGGFGTKKTPLSVVSTFHTIKHANPGQAATKFREHLDKMGIPGSVSIKPTRKGWQVTSRSPGAGHATHFKFVGNESTTTSNGEETVKLKPERREMAINSLITNGCGCWQEEDREILNAFDDDKIRDLYKSMKHHNQLEAVANAAAEFLGEPELALNAMPAALAKAKKGKPADDEEEMDDAEEEAEGEVPASKKKGPTGNASSQNKETEVLKPTAENREKRMTPDEIATINWANGEIQRQRQTIIDKLTANVAADKKEAVVNSLKVKTLGDLQLMEQLMPAPKAAEPIQQNRLPSFLGAAAPVGNAEGGGLSDQEKQEDLLIAPTLNWSEVAKANSNN